jgi:hypothetical protein
MHIPVQSELFAAIDMPSGDIYTPDTISWENCSVLFTWA